MDVHPRARQASPDLGADADVTGAVQLLDGVKRALDGHGCATPRRIWITETGAGSPHAGGVRASDPGALRAECRAMAAALERWRDDRRVEAAIQYSFREDDRFPVGLVDTALTSAYPSYELWLAWGHRPTLADGVPGLPAACR